MTQPLLVDPAQARARRTLKLAPIEVNAYDATLADERTRYGAQRLVTALRDMVLIREVETMLYSIKRGEDYHGISYAYGGPAHLSIGQEAASVGQALALSKDDHTFGSHRSHGEIIAKGMAAIEESSTDELEALIASYASGSIGAVVEEHVPTTEVKAKARAFFLYGLLAEIFGRSTGFNRGVGGSMHAFFTPFGIYPNNAIVGGSATIATGSGLFRRIQRRPGLTVANIGDGSSGCGTVWEAMNFAAMAQLHTLFDESHRGGLPVIFFFMNNFYAMGGQTVGETMGYEQLSRIGAGINAHNLHAETVDGTNPLAVADAVERARAHIEAGEGPILIDCQCYRYSGHSPSDASSYRTREEIELWRTVDPIPSFREALVQGNVLTDADAADLETWASDLVPRLTRLAIDPVISPSLSVPEIEALTYSEHADDASAAPQGELLMPLEETSRYRQLSQRARGSSDGAGGAIQLRDAIFEAVAERAIRDDRLIIYGEENRDWGGAFGVYRGLTELLPYRRLFNSPLSEAAIIGTAVGYAIEGGRAIVELMYADFLGRAGDEIFNQLAKWTAMSGGTLRVPVVVRVSIGSSYGAQHSQDWTALVAHIPGLKVVYAATPYDAKGLMAAALAQDDPVIFFESQKLYSATEYLRPEGVPADHYTVAIGEPRLVRQGRDVTLVTVGPALYRALDAAAELASRGIEADVIDVRSLVPLNAEQIVESVRRTGRVVLISDAVERGSWLHTLASEIQAAAFDYLDAPVAVVGAPNCITPPAHLEQEYFPSGPRIVDTIARLIMAVPDSTRDQDLAGTPA